MNKVLVLAFVLGLMPALALANEVVVYDTSGNLVGTYITIQQGIDACPIGGTVSVFAGTYTECVHIEKRIALVGVGTPTIDPQTSWNTVTFYGDSANGGIITGFRITGVTALGLPYAGIRCNNSSPAITNNIISGNKEYDITCDSSFPFITNNTISGNGYGIHCSSSSGTITNNTMLGNYYGIVCISSSLIITNNTILRNSYDGIYCFSSCPTITNNTISGNRWHGIYCFSSSPTIYNNIITENGTSNANYYGIYRSDINSNLVIDYNNVYNNGLGGNNNYYNCSTHPNDISSDPQFISLSDFHLQSTSHCIDKGSNTYVPSWLTIDKDGNPRIFNGIVDIGAYEYQGKILPPEILGASPPKGGNVGQITVKIMGGGFQEGAIPKLKKGGQEDILGTNTTYAPNRIITTFNLINKELGI